MDKKPQKYAIGAAIVAVMAALGRAAGGGLGAKYLDKEGVKDGKMPFSMTWLPEALICIALGAAVGVEAADQFNHALWGLLSMPAAGWVYAWVQTGHGTAYHMGRTPASAQGERKQTLSIVVDPVCKWLGWTLGERPYCYLFMGLKGLLIGLPLFPLGLIMAVLWPVAYDLGRIKNNETAEWLSCGLLGLVLAIYILT
jgi:hypothetical protein